MEYQVIMNTSSTYMLEIDVRNAIRQGWKPLGGLSVSSGNMSATPLFCQAMVRG